MNNRNMEDILFSLYELTSSTKEFSSCQGTTDSHNAAHFYNDRLASS